VPIESDFSDLEKEIRFRYMDKRKAATLQKKSVDWFVKTARYGVHGRDAITGAATVTPGDFMRGKKGIVGDPVIGQLFCYFYDPKTKDKLPYYDLFPLVMPFAEKEDGWLGLNLHYLPYYLRARLLGLIRATMRSTKFSREAKAQITYQMIKTMSRFKIAQPAIKRYLTGHVKSRIVRVAPADWQQVIFLPMEEFVKSSKEKVWRDVTDQIRKA
jgi:hypothetical protein